MTEDGAQLLRMMSRVNPMEIYSFQRRAPKASERLARHLATAIVEGEYEEGARLPHESEMLAQTQVGRATLREALRLLEVWGLVVVRTGPGGGPVVRRPAPEEFAEQMALLLQFQQLTLRDVSDARVALEPMMAHLAAQRITPEQLAELKDSIEVMRRSYDDPTQFWAQNARFHSVVAHAADSLVIAMIIDAIKFIADGASSGVAYQRAEFEEVVNAHIDIVEKLEARDADGASQSMWRHLDIGRRYVEKHAVQTLRARIQWPE